MVSNSSKPGPSGFEKREHNPWGDADEESISDMLNEELNIDSIKDYRSGERRAQIKFFGDVMSRVPFLQIFWIMHVGNDTTEKSNWAIKRTKKVHGVREHTEKQCQEYFVPHKKIAIDGSTFG
jgi:hypothetical protein